ncbi:MAG: SagB/ThcOx family dehydrogenase [Chloroflexota bacterium]|nr:SagB/ThcOx family dehydrogenase [Chloroflexota bacterium]
MQTTRPTAKLPQFRTDSSMALEATLAQRHTIRDFQPYALTDAEIGQLLWAAQGVTHEGHKRTAPSASGLNALETYVATADGLARYLPDEHALQPLSDTDLRAQLQEATGGQPFVGTAPLVVIFSTVPGRISGKHGEERGVRYSDFEAGHAGQNLLLQAVALDLGGVPIGSFDDTAVCRLLELPDGENPRYLFAIGRPA